VVTITRLKLRKTSTIAWRSVVNSVPEIHTWPTGAAIASNS